MSLDGAIVYLGGSHEVVTPVVHRGFTSLHVTALACGEDLAVAVDNHCKLWQVNLREEGNPQVSC